MILRSKNNRIIFNNSSTYTNFSKQILTVNFIPVNVSNLDYYITVVANNDIINFNLSELTGNSTQLDYNLLTPTELEVSEFLKKVIDYITLTDLERKVLPLIDENLDGNTYLGYSEFTNTSETDALWYIIKIDTDGIQSFSSSEAYTYDSIWKDRTTITYFR